MKEDPTSFPLDVRSPLVTFLQKLILLGIKVLAILMTLVILWSVADAIFTAYLKAKDPYILFTDTDEILSLFGTFLIVLIGIEIFVNIILYLRRDVGHLKLVVATALMAISRKVVILEYDHITSSYLYGIAALILALGIAYWFICRVDFPKETSDLK